MKAVISLIQRLYNCGLRPTPQRVAVLTYLSKPGNKSHLSAENIYSALVSEYPTLSRTTVYQALESLCKCGLITKLVIDEGEMQFEANTASHGHFKCTRCEKIYDFPYPDTTAFPRPGDGFEVKESYLYHKGICPKCQISATPEA